VIISRRHLIQAGAAAGLIATVARAEPLIPPGFGPAHPPAPEPVPARPLVTADPAIDPQLLARARAAFDANRSRIQHDDMIGVADFSKHSGEARFFLFDPNTGRVTQHLVSHGRGSDPGHSGWLKRFSNAFGSHATSDGAYLTAEYYYGKYGRSMRLHGLEDRNSNAMDRAIVVHSAWYAEPQVVNQHGKLGRSEGCFAFSAASHREVMERLGPGRLLYADRV
jgi:hypothetical protein